MHRGSVELLTRNPRNPRKPLTGGQGVAQRLARRVSFSPSAKFRALPGIRVSSSTNHRCLFDAPCLLDQLQRGSAHEDRRVEATPP